MASQVVGIVGETITGPHHPSVGNPICQAHARRKELLAELDAAIHGHASDTADQHLVVCKVVALHASVCPSGHREVLVSNPEIPRKFGSHLPLVSNVEAVELCPRRVDIRHLQEFANRGVASRA